MKLSADEQEFHSLLAALAARCRNELTPIEVRLYDEQLSPHGYGAVNAALRTVYMQREGNDPFPSIRKLLEIMGHGELSEKSQVTESTAKIVNLIGRFGFYLDHHVVRLGYPTMDALLLGELGEIGAEAVKVMGGWYKLWDLVCADQKFYKLQVKDAVMLVIERHRRARHLARPALGAPGRKMIANNSK